MKEEVRARMRAMLEAAIAEHGWAVQAVFPTIESPGVSFAYSIGLHAKQLPELLVMGLPGDIAQPVINEIGEYLVKCQAAGRSPLGEVPVQGWCNVYLIEAEPTLAEDYATGAYNRSRGQAQYVQIVWPDKNDLWPWSPEASQSFREAQPLLCTGTLV